MARQFHNLFGLLRDLRAIQLLDEEHEGWRGILELVDIIERFADYADALLEDAEDPPGGESDSDLDLRDGEHGSTVVRAAQRHGAMLHPALAQPTGLGSPMERARDLARAAIEPQRPADSVVRTRVETARRVIGGGDAS